MDCEPNPFIHDVERLNATPRRHFITKFIVPFATAVIGTVGFFAVIYFMVTIGHLPASHKNNSVAWTPENVNASVMTTIPMALSTATNELPTALATDFLDNSTSMATITFTTDALTPLPVEATTTESATVATTIAASTTASSTTTEATNAVVITESWTTLETPTVSTSSEPTTTDAFMDIYRDFTTPAAQDYYTGDWLASEIDRPNWLGRSPWHFCTPTEMPMQEYLDKQWMCDQCHQAVLNGTLAPVSDPHGYGYESWCYEMCFINPHFELCAQHIFEIKPRSAPHSALDCRYCNEMERHRVVIRNY